MGKNIFKPISAIFATWVKEIAHPIIIFAFSGMVFHLNVCKNLDIAPKSRDFFFSNLNKPFLDKLTTFWANVVYKPKSLK